MQSVNDFDYMSFLISEAIEDPSEYYDINRINKLKDKLSHEVGYLLNEIIENLKNIGS